MAKFSIHKLSVKQLQWLVWIGVFLIVFFTTLTEDPAAQAILFAAVNTTFYAAIVYGNISWLYPRYYERGHKTTYAVLVVFYVVALALGRGFLSMYLYNTFFAKVPEKIGFPLMLTFIAGASLDYMLSLIFRIALEYFKLKQRSEEIMVQKTRAELALLKSQVQPHFLFNTLNNIYYEAYTEAPKTAGLIEKLSEIMRYFVDESPKDKVPLSAEVKFLENYIELEKIRLRYGADIHFEKDIDDDVMIPPMLLMTFTENIFKHGIDKMNSVNQINIVLTARDNWLGFQTSNLKPAHVTLQHGFGLKNLRERLSLLYGENYQLSCSKRDGVYIAYLKIPIA